ncbi:MAG: adenine phosphoribosyltransferase [Clostridiales bacterium]|nr:adenine phosphoribosyltransferase [Clostridiales bacterium]
MRNSNENGNENNKKNGNILLENCKAEGLKSKLRHVMNFPKEGIDFIDITPVLLDPEAFGQCLGCLKDKIAGFGDFDVIVGPESRGFIFGAPLAYVLNKGFAPIRKKGKLPYKTISVQYELEYGVDTFEIHEDAIQPGQKVVIVDDLLATGGTTVSNINLVERLGGQVAGIVYFIELSFLEGRSKMKGYKVESIVTF